MAHVLKDRLRQLKYRYVTPPPSLIVFFEKHAVAELRKEEGRFFFRYLDKFSELSLSPIPGFPDTDRKDPYVSDELFPFFAERIPDTSRPEIKRLIEKLGLKKGDELQWLAELSRYSVTDPFEFKLSPAA